MRIALVPVTEKGAAFAEKTASALQGHECVTEAHSPELFSRYNAIVYICAAGIAVRRIAPHLKDKLSDPAVVVCDENGTWAVSLTGGHLAGANALAREIARATGAVAVVTTASETGEFTPGPKNVILGIGCRRGVSAQAVETAAMIALYHAKVRISRVAGIATIDVKRDEEGLCAFSRLAQIPLSFFSSRELEAVEGEFSESPFVRRTVGTGSVCERAAALLGGEGRMIRAKTSRQGVSVAVFERRSPQAGEADRTGGENA